MAVGDGTPPFHARAGGKGRLWGRRAGGRTCAPASLERPPPPIAPLHRVRTRFGRVSQQAYEADQACAGASGSDTLPARGAGARSGGGGPPVALPMSCRQSLSIVSVRPPCSPAPAALGLCQACSAHGGWAA